jgi:hypothetical protein
MIPIVFKPGLVAGPVQDPVPGFDQVGPVNPYFKKKFKTASF